MSQHARKLGFWSVFALVTGSQIGSGVFMLPANLAPYGPYSFAGWAVAGCGAVMLALVFAQLCAWFPRTGGPHVYVQEAFGTTAAFFTGWTYWIISWVSSTVVIIATIGYLTPLIGNNPVINTALEIILLCSLTALNFRGISTAGKAEFVLTLLKLIPLFLVPLVALFYFDSNNFFVDPSVANLSALQIIGRITLFTLWGFIGLESATTPAESVKNPSQTIPRAVVSGTMCVAVLYVINSLAIMGAMPGRELMQSNAPYADVVQSIFGGNWHLFISLIATAICIGTLNAWMVTSSHIALGLAQEKLMPHWVTIKNNYGAPVWGLIISSVGIIPLLLLTTNKDLVNQILTIIDFSVTAFLFIYMACCLAFLKIIVQKREPFAAKVRQSVYGIIAFLFCAWIIYATPLYTLLIASLFTVAGIPLYLWNWYKRSV